MVELHQFCAVVSHGVKTGVGSSSKLMFGSGTRLKVQSREEFKPSYFKLTDKSSETTACLATGFSRLNATANHPSFESLHKKNYSAVRISGDSLYNQVALLPPGNETCTEDTGEPGTCAETLEPDEKVNFITMTVLGLRLLFLKTVVFNVLMTLRLWMSR
ncbi:igV_TCR_alpha and Ig domain-containing protein isoform X5 [Anabas testudineus]|uniref:igV_TCR_alpha and Ig domain-containing protein isoform X5 n=1 Tax=Anabas testudineus TaxID=64144 RepID=UPI00143DF78F|nr:igV_TCR_alpha and Ig domain-containing protein isoform X5 [Anabas testudineus]